MSGNSFKKTCDSSSWKYTEEAKLNTPLHSSNSPNQNQKLQHLRSQKWTPRPSTNKHYKRSRSSIEFPLTPQQRLLSAYPRLLLLQHGISIQQGGDCEADVRDGEADECYVEACAIGTGCLWNQLVVRWFMMMVRGYLPFFVSGYVMLRYQFF